jgi:hypothetical protein
MFRQPLGGESSARRTTRFSAGTAKVLPGISVEVVQSRGATGSATVVRLTERPEMLLAAKRIARRLGLSGFFGLDFMLRPARRWLSK